MRRGRGAYYLVRAALLSNSKEMRYITVSGQGCDSWLRQHPAEAAFTVEATPYDGRSLLSSH
jgi:hypothetical protein